MTKTATIYQHCPYQGLLVIEDGLPTQPNEKGLPCHDDDDQAMSRAKELAQQRLFNDELVYEYGVILQDALGIFWVHLADDGEIEIESPDPLERPECDLELDQYGYYIEDEGDDDDDDAPRQD